MRSRGFDLAQTLLTLVQYALQTHGSSKGMTKNLRTADSCSTDSLLLTDLYQLTMLQGYFDQRMEETAVFEFFVRKLPRGRNFLMAAGLEQALEYLEDLRFTPAELDWLASCGRFRRDFVDYLDRLRFTGDVHAMAEGTVFFPHEPILRVTAPLPQAQLVESRLINILQFQTLIASKASRSVLVAPDKLLVDFGMRRAHGAEAGLLAARAAYLAGFSGSATVLAGQLFDMPIYGTMAHSFVQAHDDEVAAFEHFALANPDNVVLLLDTYDTEAAAEKTVELAACLKAKGIAVKGVRLDSGDLGEHARRVRRILDDGGLTDVTIFASGNLDEFKLHTLVSAGAPIDGFGIGSRLDVSADAPYLDCAYKLQEYAGRPRRKRSEGKATWPGRKQVYRTCENGVIAGDSVTLEDDPKPGEPLLHKVMSGGQRAEPAKPLEQIRTHAAANLACFPPRLRQLEDGALYPVEISQSLRELARSLDESIGERSMP
jgi:nicotinate phosphoribosyltransferase